MDQVLMLERIPFPKFYRKLRKWADFRRFLKDMMKEIGSSAGDGKAYKRNT